MTKSRKRTIRYLLLFFAATAIATEMNDRANCPWGEWELRLGRYWGIGLTSWMQDPSRSWLINADESGRFQWPSARFQMVDIGQKEIYSSLEGYRYKIHYGRVLWFSMRHSERLEW